MPRTFLTSVLSAIAAALILTAPARAETWNLGHLMPAESSEGKVHQMFAELVKEYTNGELSFNIFPASQLGRANAQLQQVEAGTLQIYVEGIGSGNQYVKELEWISAPFLYDDLEHWQRFIRSGAMKEYFDKLASEHNISIIGDPTIMARGPFRTIVTKEPFHGLADLQDLNQFTEILPMYSQNAFRPKAKTGLSLENGM